MLSKKGKTKALISLQCFSFMLFHCKQAHHWLFSFILPTKWKEYQLSILISNESNRSGLRYACVGEQSY